jgi:cobalt/nickel transport system ATP-binding protein
MFFSYYNSTFYHFLKLLKQACFTNFFSTIKSSINKMKSFAILAKDLRYNYPDGTAALKGITFQIQTGEKVAVIGPNGSGKSTLLTLFNGVRTAEGTLNIFDLPIIKKNLPYIKKSVGIVFQNPDDQLFCPTIFEDVAFGPLNLGLSPEMVKQKVYFALKQVGLSGYGSRSSFHLSYGERKIASLATVLAMEPQIIAMDEPTSNLDLSHRRKIITWIQQSHQTIIVTTHDLDMILDTCERVLMLNKGKLVADNTVKKILTDRHLLEANDLELPLSYQPSKIKI